MSISRVFVDDQLFPRSGPWRPPLPVKRMTGSCLRAGRWMDGSVFYNTSTWERESCLAYLKDAIQTPYDYQDYQGTLKGLLEYFMFEHNKNVEDKKKFTVENVMVINDNDYVRYATAAPTSLLR